MTLKGARAAAREEEIERKSAERCEVGWERAEPQLWERGARIIRADSPGWVGTVQDAGRTSLGEALAWKVQWRQYHSSGKGPAEGEDMVSEDESYTVVRRWRGVDRTRQDAELGAQCAMGCAPLMLYDAEGAPLVVPHHLGCSPFGQVKLVWERQSTEVQAQLNTQAVIVDNTGCRVGSVVHNDDGDTSFSATCRHQLPGMPLYLRACANSMHCRCCPKV